MHVYLFILFITSTPMLHMYVYFFMLFLNCILVANCRASLLGLNTNTKYKLIVTVENGVSGQSSVVRSKSVVVTTETAGECGLPPTYIYTHSYIPTHNIHITHIYTHLPTPTPTYTYHTPTYIYTHSYIPTHNIHITHIYTHLPTPTPTYT